MTTGQQHCDTDRGTNTKQGEDGTTGLLICRAEEKRRMSIQTLPNFFG